LIQNRSA